MTARNYINGAPLLTLAVQVDSSAVTLEVDSTAGFPDPPFVIAMERATSNEEVVLCTGKTLTTFTVVRGWDNTTPKAHGIGAAVEHTTAAIDYREANEHHNSIGDVHPQYLLRNAFTGKGRILVGTGAGAWNARAVGSNGLALLADSGQSDGVTWGQISTAGIANSAVTAAKVANGAINDDKLASNAVIAAKIASNAVTTAKVANGAINDDKLASSSVVNAKIANLAVSTGKLADSAVTAAKIANSTITEAKLASAVLSSGWSNIGYGTGWGTPLNGLRRMAVKRIGNLVVISGAMRRTGSTVAPGLTTMGNVPGGFRPPSECVFVLGTGIRPDPDVTPWASVAANGNITCTHAISGSNNWFLGIYEAA